MTKAEVRAHAARLGLVTATKPDSQDVCFITATGGGRRQFLADRLALHPGVVVDHDGAPAGTVEAVELVTVGQRRGMGHATDGRRRYVTSVDLAQRRVVVGPAEVAASDRVRLAWTTMTWVDRPLGPGAAVLSQTSAHGRPAPGTFAGGPGDPMVTWAGPQRPVAPGQTVALYDPARPDSVVGSGIAR